MDKLERRLAILQALIHEYIRTARPVSSKQLSEEYCFDCSPATIRNEMAALEEAGYIEQPHTSAGRIPTETGYQFYIRNFLPEKELNKTQQRTLTEAAGALTDDVTTRMKRMAKAVAEVTNETVLVTFGRQNYFYTGISNMFRKPEFAELEMMMAMTEAFDEMDELLEAMDGMMGDDISVFIGSDNPFPASCAFLASRYLADTREEGVLGILGPMRMDYDTNIAILHYLESLMTDSHERQG